MNSLLRKLQSNLRHTRTRRGFALILVLGFLVLITGLVLAFFTSVTTELSSANSYSSGANTRQLADSAVQTVMGTIRNATGKGTTITWASQPGMIRTFDSSTTKSKTVPLALQYYKLYSSDNLEVTASQMDSDPVTGKLFDPVSDVDPAWDTEPALFTDLNSPVTDGTGSNIFPIIDPTAAATVSGNSTLVDGFSYATQINGKPIFDGTGKSKAITTPSSTSDSLARLPMPVKWMYVLKDGTLSAADATSTSTATFKNAPSYKQPSASNPIVGRIAYWTDDETCKLNINTASEGSYWEAPSFSTTQDLAFARYQPMAKEYNRYLGHPATTSLSPVLWSYYTGYTSPTYSPHAMPQWKGGTFADDVTPSLPAYSTSFYNSIVGNISPRYAWGGSKSGTLSLLPNASSPATPITATNLNRLYANVDELFFGTPSASASLRPQNVSANGVATISAGDINKLRFFLTANSRSPEVNPFNLPKVTMWPIPAGPSTANPSASASDYQSVADKLIAFCSTLNAKPYYFTRKDPTSSTADFTLRNQDLYKYLRKALDNPVPGFGGSFVSKSRWQGTQGDQILTLVYDYIRSCINLVDSSGPAAAPFKYSYTVPPLAANSSGQNILSPGTGQVIPIVNPINNTKGIGRFPTLRGATLMFIANGANQPPLLTYANGTFANYPVIYNSGGTPLWDGSGSSIPAGVTAQILSGTTYAKVNFMHPWILPPSTVDSPNSLVPQLKSGGSPVLAGAVPNLYPVFNLYPSKTGTTTSYTQSFASTIVNTSATANKIAPYPSLSGSTLCYSTATGSVLVSGGANYYKAGLSAGASSTKTHAGLNYLSAQDPSTGAFNLANANFVSPGGNLAPLQTRMEAVLILDPVNVAPGLVGTYPDCKVNITSGLSAMQASAKPLFSGATAEILRVGGTTANDLTPAGFGETTYNQSFQLTLQDRSVVSTTTANKKFPYWSGPITVPGETFPFTGSTMVVEMQTSSGTTVQTLNMKFPSANFPTPKLPIYYKPATNSNPQALGPIVDSDVVTSPWLTFNGAMNRVALIHNGSQYFGYELLPPEYVGSGSEYTKYNSADTLRSIEFLFGDTRQLSALKVVPHTFFAPNPLYNFSSIVQINKIPTYIRPAHSLTRSGTGLMPFCQFNSLSDPSNTNYMKYPGNFIPGGYSTAVPPVKNPLDNKDVSNLLMYERGLTASPVYGGSYIDGSYPFTTPSCNFSMTAQDANAQTTFSNIWNKGGDFDNGVGQFADGPFINKTDEGSASDGGVSKSNPYYTSGSFSALGTSKFSPNRQVESAVVFGSLPVGFGLTNSLANPDPKMLQDGWRTLLFCPNPNAPTSALRDARATNTDVTEAGALLTSNKAPDHLLLDFFHMPVVEPYPISEPFSTAGKVNMNYQIAPFTYIKRNTALRGVLKSVLLTAVDDRFTPNYKDKEGGSRSSSASASLTLYSDKGAYDAFGNSSSQMYFRYPVHLGETLKQFDQRFSNGDIFRSPSEVCSLWLYPATQPSASNPDTGTALVTQSSPYDVTNSAIKNWWYGSPGATRKSLTGDNIRERPYASIYPRLTTKSNSYTVHFRVQTLKKVINTDPAQWVESKDQMVSEYRGSSLIERYIDPSDPSLPDFATNTTETVDKYYKFRVVSTKKFAPQ